ncbi:MAG: diguanylate cyclase [Selenomonadaceae bacterium]|nr:diguanylate cyclase [Selenomonadaceae bacterium]
MKKILIVDDMMVSLMMTENILATQYTTVCASSGQEAIEVYRQERPDMVLSDLRMPGMSGYELQSTLQEEYNQVIPFMFMTADHDEETESKGFDNGAMDFIRKPFRPDVLLRRVANILQTVEQIQGLKKHASIDKLTGLLNKASSEEELTNICKSSNGALMMIDLDSFKLVNDIHGHAMGDKILISFSEIIRSAMRPTDLVGRMGGDEFIAFCNGMQDESAIANKSEYINQKLVESAKKLMGEDMNIPLGASIGCVLVPTEGTDFAELYKKADKALYVVKQNGKHGYNIFNSSQQVTSEEISDVTNLANIEMILSERNQNSDAYILPMESFRAVYRFLQRIMSNRGIGIPGCILLISLKLVDESDTPDISISEVGSQFLSTLKSTLRRSDTITQSSNNQFVIILYNISLLDVHHVVKRIKSSWEELPASKYYSITCEWDVLESSANSCI